MTDDQLDLRALERGLAMRAPECVGNVAAGLRRWRRSEDGHLVAEVRLCDGERFGWVEVRVPPGAGLPRDTHLELEIERYAQRVARESRLEALEQLSPLPWTADGTIAPPR